MPVKRQERKMFCHSVYEHNSLAHQSKKKLLLVSAQTQIELKLKAQVRRRDKFIELAWFDMCYFCCCCFCP